jgi:Chemotaxis phosphatase CheX
LPVFVVTMTPATQALCLDALTESASELTRTVLGGLGFQALGPSENMAAGNGAYLALVAQEEPVQVGILMDDAGCQRLSKALLGMEAGDEDLPPTDVSDAMCEIINIIAGGLKRRVSPELPVAMGLPLFVSGHPLPNPHQSVSARALKIGDVSASVLLLTQKPNPVPISRRGATIHTAGNPSAKESLA